MNQRRDAREPDEVGREVAESQARLSSIVSSAMDAIITVDAEQRVTLFNPAAERMFGCRAGDVLGQPLERFIPARYHQSHHHAVEEFGRTGMTSRSMGHLRPLTGLRANGKEFPVEASIAQSEVRLCER